jgi:hypothetical protein
VKDINLLYARLCTLPFPALGKSIGDFALYDALLASLASRASQGHLISVAEVPVPDEQTITQVTKLRAKGNRSRDETAFLDYFDALEEIRSALSRGR